METEIKTCSEFSSEGRSHIKHILVSITCVNILVSVTYITALSLFHLETANTQKIKVFL